MKILFSSILFLLSFWTYATDYNSILYYFKKEDFINADIEINRQITDKQLKEQYSCLSKLLKYRTHNQSIDTLSHNRGTNLNKLLNNLIIGYQLSYSDERNNGEAFKYFSKALKIAYKERNNELTKTSLIAILNLLRKYITIEENIYKPYLEHYELLIKNNGDDVDLILLKLYKSYFYSKEHIKKEADELYCSIIRELNDFDDLVKNTPNNHPLLPYIHYELGIRYKFFAFGKVSENCNIKFDDCTTSCHFNNAIKAFNKSYELAEKFQLHSDIKSASLWQIADLYYRNDNVERSKEKIALLLKFNQRRRDSFDNHYLISRVAEKEALFEKAFFHLKRANTIDYQLKARQNSFISTVMTENNNLERWKTNFADADNKRIKNKKYFVFSLILLAVAIIIGYLLYKNTKRKQRIAEQEKALAAERANNILNNQKLAIIDAMVSGQEKERERLASDLHDNIGNTMTSIKFYVEHLEQQLNEEKLTPSLINNLKKLVSEAANKIRGISHEKNTGVFANEGLLIAIKRLAKAIERNHTLTINIWDHGLDKRIENRLELTLFRIIQELLTNIVKHAQATEVSISLTNHDNILNIMVEDDGIGFHLNDLKLKEGMGLRSIEIRIEKLGGSVEIDSYPNNGTTIIIDIPI